MVAKEFLSLSNGCSKGVQPCPQKRKSLLVKFKTLEMAKQKVPGQIRNTTGPGCPGARPGSGSGGPGLLSPHSPGPLATRWPYPRGWDSGSPRVGRESGRVKNGQMGSGHGGPGRSRTGVMTGEGSQSGENHHWVYEE